MAFLSSINPVDIAVSCIIAVNIIIGLKRGLSGELAGLVGVIVALMLGVLLLAPFSGWLEEHTRLSYQAARGTAFIAVTVSVLITVIPVRLVLRKIMKITFEPTLERIGGCIAGIIRSAVLILIIFVAVLMCPHDYLNRKFGEESVVGRVIVKYVMPRVSEQPIVEKVESDIHETIDDLGDDIKKR